jgi:TolB-like protein/DNA-binding winged helix-turn-helix (wHTH) protein/Tfp pilus assembly protein PilF
MEASTERYTFHGFELDAIECELKYDGNVVRLEKIPFELLTLLVRRRGELITREDIAEALWGKGVTQDFENGINTAVRKIRIALGDDAEEPRFLQTVVGRGYRFVAPVEGQAVVAKSPSPGVSKTAAAPARRAFLLLTLGPALAIVIGAGAYWMLTHPAAQGKPVVIAVLPFASMSADANQQYFTDGVTEDIITELGRINGSRLRVIARTSVMRYANSRVPVDQVARELGAGYVLEGSARRDGRRVRITAQLIRTSDQTHIWAQQYDRDLDSVLSLQGEVAPAVAREVRVRIASENHGGSAAASKIDPQAYDLYLRGRYALNQRTESSLHTAVGQFERAIAIEPSYVAAHAALADSYAALVYGNYLAPSEGFSRAKGLIAKAKQLDPDAAETWASEGYLNMYFDWDFETAEKNLRKAIELNPSYAAAHDWLGVLLTAEEKFREARAELESARAMDPLSLPILTDIGFELHYAGRNQEALEALRAPLALNAGFPPALFWMGRIYGTEGRCEEAFHAFNAFPAALGEWQPLIAAEGYLAGKCGMRERARASLETFRLLAQKRYVTSYGVALVHAGLGDAAETLLSLRKAYDERSHWMVWLRLDPRWKSVRADPQFAKLEREVFTR